MYGQDDNSQQQHDAQDWQQPQDEGQVVQPTQQDEGGYQDGSLEVPATNVEQAPAPSPDPAIPGPSDWGQPAAVAPVSSAPVADTDTDTDTDTNEAAAAPSAPDAPSSDLLDIKQKALTELSPLVSHLDQTPEEKFKTTMMMIQASDNQALVPEAYAAAKAIPDEKAKAQALLDIVNEINYFTQHQS